MRAESEENLFMKFRFGTLALGLLLLVSAACNKPSQQPADNSAQNPDNTANSAAQPNADNSQQQAAQPRVPVTVTIPAGKTLTVRLSEALGSKISKPGKVLA